MASKRRAEPARNSQPNKRHKSRSNGTDDGDDDSGEEEYQPQVTRRTSRGKGKEKEKEKEVERDEEDEEDDIPEWARIDQDDGAIEAPEDRDEAVDEEEFVPSTFNDADEWNNEDEEEEDVEVPEGEAGLIERIKLENFMCHKHLELSLGPNINFIVGVNGSGKSAVLVALTVCLGAKAGFTNRGKRLSEFIRGTASHANIAVTLTNRGTEAYHFKEYGPSITIERRILRNGGSSYKAKSAKGRTVASTRREVGMILEQFNIQIDNPCVILMQDTSRQFLNTSRPQDKYTFFLKATQLEQMKLDYEGIKRRLSDMRNALSRKEETLPEMKKKVEELQRLYKSLESVRNLQAQVQTFKEMLAWSYVVDKEKQVAEAKEKSESFGENLQQNETVLEKIKTALGQYDQELKDKMAEITKLTEEGNKINTDVEEAKQHLSELTREQNASKSSVKDFLKRMENIAKRKENVERHIEETKRQALSDTQKELEERKARIADLQGRQDSLKEELQAITQQREEKDAEVSSAREAMRKVDIQHDEANRELQHAIQEKKNLLLQQQDDKRRFGKAVPELLAAIDRERRWKHRPIGPVGLHLKLRDHRWATAIDAAIGKILTVFIVDNPQDMRLLKEIGRQVGSEPEMIIQHFTDRSYTIPKEDLPPPHLTTVLSQVETNHPMINNILIDQSSIESKILINTLNEAKDIMYRQRPPNAKFSYLPDGARVFMNGSTEVFNAGSGSSRRFGVDYAAAIREAEARIPDKQAALEALKAEKENFSRQTRQLSDESREYGREVVRLQRQISELQNQILELQSVKERELPDIQELERNVQAFAEDLEKLQESREAAEAQIAEIENKRRPWVEKVAEKQKISATLGKENERITTELSNINNRIRKLTVQQNAAEKQKKEFEGRKQSFQEEYEKLCTELEEVTQKATRFCAERVTPDESSHKLAASIDKLEKRIAHEQEGKKSAAEITAEFQNALKSFREISGAVDRLNSLKKGLEGNLASRLQRWLQFRKSIAMRTRIHFNSYLTRKNYAGEIAFGHKEKILEIEIRLDNASQQQESTMRNTKSLSGGERSFSTVALLLALWEAMECPFRAMDEFDVFMDAVNRHISISLLIEAARIHVNRQFIFITPHDLTAIISGPDIRIHKMFPPDRGGTQTTLQLGN